MTVVGGVLPVQGRINGELTIRLGSPLTVAAINFIVGLVILVIATVSRRVSARRLLAVRTRWWHWLGGICGALGVCSMAWGVPKLGVALAGVSLAAGMATGGLFADAVGLGRADLGGVALSRVGGALLAVGAVLVSMSGRFDAGGDLPYVAFAMAGGFAMGCQQPINGRLGAAVGDAGLAAVASFTVGLTALVGLVALDSPSVSWPTEPWLYVGGALAAGYILVGLTIVGRLGALRLSLATIAGQLTGSAALDAFAPIRGQGLTANKLVGVALVMVAVVLASGLSVRRAVTTEPSAAAPAELPVA